MPLCSRNPYFLVVFCVFRHTLFFFIFSKFASRLRETPTFDGFTTKNQRRRDAILLQNWSLAYARRSFSNFAWAQLNSQICVSPTRDATFWWSKRSILVFFHLFQNSQICSRLRASHLWGFTTEAKNCFFDISCQNCTLAYARASFLMISKNSKIAIFASRLRETLLFDDLKKTTFSNKWQYLLLAYARRSFLMNSQNS